MSNYVELWRFETARCAVIFDVTPDDDVDTSWDDSGVTADNLNSGLWCAFNSRIRVMVDGVERGSDYLCGSVYENPSDFIDHRGMKATGYGSYFSDMVREAIGEARKALSGAPLRLRTLSVSNFGE